MHVERRCLIKAPSMIGEFFITTIAIENIQNDTVKFFNFRCTKRLYDDYLGCVGYIDGFEIVQLENKTYEIWGNVHSEVPLKNVEISFCKHLSFSDKYINGICNVYSLSISEFYIKK